MAQGPGKYDNLCTYVREQAKAEAAIVIVFHGELGSGFSVQSLNFEITALLPNMLRSAADQIDEGFCKNLKN